MFHEGDRPTFPFVILHEPVPNAALPSILLLTGLQTGVRNDTCLNNYCYKLITYFENCPIFESLDLSCHYNYYGMLPFC